MNLDDRIKRLEALHPQLAEPEVEWVELSTPVVCSFKYRVSLDGRLAQQKNAYSDWRPMFPPDADDNCYVQCYRAGLVQGQNQARELAEAVERVVWGIGRPNMATLGAVEIDLLRGLARAILEAAE